MNPFASILGRTLACAGLALVLVACATEEEADPNNPSGVTNRPTVPAGTRCSGDGECGGGKCVNGACSAGFKCENDAACPGGRCVDGACVPATATDGRKNGDETDVDCGGALAPRCADGKACAANTDCTSKVCKGGVCQAPTATDGVQNGDESDVDCGGLKGPGCKTGGACKAAIDCESKVCGADKKCVEATNTDGVQNGTETDIDCGGGAPTNAPVCPAGKACKLNEDCFWGHCTANVCEGHRPGTKDGDQTDIDCGGTASPACDWEKGCKVDKDCTTKACGPDKKCLTGPSCAAVHGGTTCGTGEFGDGFKVHETCCRSLKVTGFADAQHPGKTVYLDKYEITAGRMRVFLESLGANPNVKAWMAANRPSRWNTGWEDSLPTGNLSKYTYTVTNPTGNLLYPGQDKFAGSGGLGTWSVVSGTYTIDNGLFRSLAGPHFFPEFNPDYAASHDLNCTNTANSYGYGTYWQPAATISAANADGSIGKYYSKNDLDEKALNCVPFNLLAAFCAWDGGQLMTQEVFDFVAGGPWPNLTPSNIAGTPPPPRLAGANQPCGPGGNSLNTFSDGAGGCYSVYFYPNDFGNTYDGSAKIAPPGRVAADTVRLVPADQPWMDLKGNLEEAVIRSDGIRFDYRGYGVSYTSILFHKVQQTTARMKGGSFGGRCMRFK